MGMDEKINEKTETFMDNITTMVGVACLAYPIIRQVTKTLVPEMQKLTSGNAIKEIQMLSGKQEKDEKPERESERESQNEIAELKRKLAELEEKKEFPYDKQEG